MNFCGQRMISIQDEALILQEWQDKSSHFLQPNRIAADTKSTVTGSDWKMDKLETFSAGFDYLT